MACINENYMYGCSIDILFLAMLLDCLPLQYQYKICIFCHLLQYKYQNNWSCLVILSSLFGASSSYYKPYEVDLMNWSQAQTKCAFSEKLPQHKFQERYSEKPMSSSRDAAIQFSVSPYPTSSRLISSLFSLFWFRRLNTRWQHRLTHSLVLSYDKYKHTHTTGRQYFFCFPIRCKSLNGFDSAMFWLYLFLWFPDTGKQSSVMTMY